MLRSTLLGSAALLALTSGFTAPSQAGSFETRPATPASISIREVDFPRWENNLLQQAPLPLLASADVASAPQVVQVTTGQASWYGPGFYGNRTANGEVYRQGTLTAAHRSLPFGTRVRVTNLRNGRSTVVRINDRGPFVGHRVIDLGHGAAQELGVIASGVAQVRLEVLR